MLSKYLRILKLYFEIYYYKSLNYNLLKNCDEIFFGGMEIKIYIKRSINEYIRFCVALRN